MSFKIKGMLVAPIVLASVVALAQQPQRTMTARELFYTPLATKKQVTTPAVPDVPKEKTTPAVPPKEAKRPTKKNTEQYATQNPPTASRPSRIEVPLMNASNESYIPLALKYTLSKRTADGSYEEVDTDTVFKSGDRIRVSVEPNDTAYLYIIQQGSSKAWSVLFPREEIANGSNRVERNQAATIPSSSAFYFDNQPGTEKLFILLTRRPEQDLEKLIYNLSSSPAAAPKPTSTEPVPDDPAPKRMMFSKNLTVEDSFVNKLRSSMLARDLVFDNAKENVGAGRMDKSVYVATKDRSADARLRAEFELKHQ